MLKSLHRRTDSQRLLAPPSKPSSSVMPLTLVADSPALDGRPPSPLASLADVLRPRKSRARATVLALVALVLLSAYILLVAPPSLAVSPPPLFHPASAPPQRLQQQHPDISDPWARLVAKYRDDPARSRTQPALRPAQELELDPPHELAALTAFMAALAQNVLPPAIDPHAPLDPTLVLDFDTRSPAAPAELARLVADVWTRNPVVLFAKARSPASRELKTLLARMDLRPAPTIFDVDERDDADVLVPLLHRLTGVANFPILLVGGAPVGDAAVVRELAADGSLKALVERAGAEPGASAGGRKKKKGRSA